MNNKILVYKGVDYVWMSSHSFILNVEQMDESLAPRFLRQLHTPKQQITLHFLLEESYSKNWIQIASLFNEKRNTHIPIQLHQQHEHEEIQVTHNK